MTTDSTKWLPLAGRNIDRLNHKAYVTSDQEATRHFWEDVIGLRLATTWCMHVDGMGAFVNTYYEMLDGGAIAFFTFANPEVQELLRHRPLADSLDHIALNVDEATQIAIRERLIKDGRKPEELVFTDHKVCVSFSTIDPNGISVELCRDTVKFSEIAAKHKIDAHSELKRWLAGDHTPNNNLR